MGLVFRLVVGGIEVVYAALKAGFHYGEVLVGQGYVDYHVGFMAVEELYQLGYAVGVDRVGEYVVGADGLDNGVALRFCARCYYDFVEDLTVLSAFVCHDGTYTARTDNKNFRHFFLLPYK